MKKVTCKPTNRQPVFVTVLSKTGKVLEPTNRCGHVRYLLKEGKAKVVRSKPFTIQLTYDTDEVTQGETLGIDAGRTNIGLATVKDGGQCTARFKVTTRNKEIPKLMKVRKEFRRKHRDFGRRDVRQRRAIKNATFVKGHQIDRLLPGCKEPVHCKEIRNKEARFNNRVRPKGWLTPTARHLLETHLHCIDKMLKIRPIKTICIETNRFAFMELQARLEGQDIKNIDYQHGPKYDCKDVNDAVFKEQEGKCLLCGKKKIVHYHHIVPQHKNGSDTIGNIAGLCSECHDVVHKDDISTEMLKQKKKGFAKKFAGTSILNTIMPQLIEQIAIRYPNIALHITTGYETKAFREVHGLDKDHDIDAYCIACSALSITEKDINTNVSTQKIMQFRRQDRQCCNVEMIDRKYYLDGKVVATNRHKRTEQKTDSLEEFRKTHTKSEVSRLTVKKHPPQYKNRNRIMPGAIIEYTEKLSKKQIKQNLIPQKTRFVLSRSEGFHNGKTDYYISTLGQKFRANRCNFVTLNTGLVFV